MGGDPTLVCADRYLALGAEWGGGSASRRRCRSAFASRADGGGGGGGTVQQCAKWERGGLEVQLHNRARLDVEGGGRRGEEVQFAEFALIVERGRIQEG